MFYFSTYWMKYDNYAHTNITFIWNYVEYVLQRYVRNVEEVFDRFK